MKTAEDWANEKFSFGADTKTDFIGLIKQIQLDAMKEGMRRAAMIPNEMRDEGESDLRCVRDRIRFAADKLTLDTLNH